MENGGRLFTLNLPQKMEEENLEFTAILKQFGLDVSYMIQQFKKNVDKNINHLNNHLDTQRFCSGLTELFQEFSNNTVLFTKNLEEKIKACGKQEDYKEIIQKLQGLSARSSNSSCSCVKPVNSVVDPITADIDKVVSLKGSANLQSVGVPELSQCSSVHIQDEVKDEGLSSQSLNNAGNSQPESCHSTDGSTSTVIYDCNSGELLQPRNDQSTSQDDNTNIFSQSTVPNTFVNQNQDSRLQISELANLTENEAATFKDLTQKQSNVEECLENSQRSSSAGSNKEKLSSIVESDDSNVEFVQNDKSTFKQGNEEAVTQKVGEPLNWDSDSTVENLPKGNDAKGSNSSENSDLTVENLSPADNSDKQGANIEGIRESICDAVMQINTYGKANHLNLFDQATQANTKETGVIDNNHGIFDETTQVFEKQKLVTEESITQAVNKATTLNNSKQSPISPEGLSSELVNVTEADFDKFTQEIAANIRTESPKEFCNNESEKNGDDSNNSEDIFNAATQVVTNTRATSSYDEFDKETQVCLPKLDSHAATTVLSKTNDNDNHSLINPTDAGDGNRSDATANGDGGAPDDGDVSGSETSDDTLNTKSSKKKLNDKDKKSLLKVIHKFYVKRKNERLRQSKNLGDSESSSDEKNVKKLFRKSPKKRDRKSSEAEPISSEKIVESAHTKSVGKTRKHLFDDDSASDVANDKPFIQRKNSNFKSTGSYNIHEAPTQKSFIRELSKLSVTEADKLVESDDGILLRRKSVRPLPETQSTTDSEIRPDSDDSDLATPFKRKTVHALKPTQSDLDQECEGKGAQAEERVPKRVRSPDSEVETQKVLRSLEASDSNSDNHKTQVVKKIKLNHTSEGSGLDDNARNDFLDMLEEHANINHPASQNDSFLLKGQEKGKTSEELSQFNLGDSDRDCLLDMLTEKEGEFGASKKDEKIDTVRNKVLKQPSVTDQDNYLIDDISSNEESDPGNKIIDDFASESDQPNLSKKISPKFQKLFKLDETEKDELLKILSDHIKENDSDSGKDSSESEKEDNDEVAQKRKLFKEGNKKNEKRRKRDIGRKELLELVNDFEEAVSKGKDSDADSVFLEVLREETVMPNKPKDGGVWDIYKTIIKQKDNRFGYSGSDISDMEDDGLKKFLAKKKRKKAEDLQNIKWRKQYGFKKELYVKITREDLSGYDLGESNRREKGNPGNKGTSDEIDRLCDLTSLARKRKKRVKSNRGSRSKSASSEASIGSSCSSTPSKPKAKPRRKYSDDFEVPFSYDEDSMEANRNSSSPDAALFNYVSEDDFEVDIAHALLETVRDSSAERGDTSSSDNSVRSDDSRTKAAKKRKEKREAATLKRGQESGEDNNKLNTESGDDSNSNDHKEKETKEVDLDSSDEEDFVGVRKSRPAWRCDPLLNGRLSTSSSSESDTGEDTVKKRKRRRRIRRKNMDSSSGDEESQGKLLKVTKKPFIFSDLSDSSDSEDDFDTTEKEATPQKPILITDDEDTPSKRGKGRRNIRALLEEDDLAEATQKAHNEEKERVKRLQERDKAKEVFSQSGPTQSEDEVNPLILDVSDEVTIKVHPKITKRLKPHQRNGIQFMWDSCYESLSQLEKNYKGSGCILAHCMGLGKTLQALALIQTLFSYEDLTKTKHVLVVCPLSTVSNWRNEYKLAYKHIRDSKVKLYTIENIKAAKQRFEIISKWHRTGGVLVLGYECFGLCINEQKLKKLENTRISKEKILEALVDPGPDLIICDEGHLLRNKQAQRTLALNKVKTKRRIVLTGTPLQNNLLEYYYMVNFVKPDLLGTEKEYKTNFVNPINNGQFEDSTAGDIMFMKKRSHILHKILTNTVQRVEDTELKQYLPKLIDQAVFVKLSDLQVNLYNTYLDFVHSKPVTLTKAGNVSHKNFLADVQILSYICSHPNLVTIAEKNHKSKIKELDVIDEMIDDAVDQKVFSRAGWYRGLLSPEGVKDLELGTKVKVALSIVEEAIKNKDKVLIFAQSHAEMDNLENFFAAHLKFKKNKDYYRMDGTISPEVRTSMCDKFNSKNNSSIRVFIMSIKVGGLGLNLTAANRVILMNVNWNPSYDTQSVFRAFRFGQTKAVFVYRLITIDTVEEKIYQRGVTKLAVAHRVVDKHQITRHYNAADIQEFYSARPTIQKDRPMPNVPEDRVLANLVLKHQFVYKWHEHQDLLANRPEEELDEQEKNAAWEEYNQKEILPPPNYGHQNHMMGQPGPSGTRPQYPFTGSTTNMSYINPKNIRSHVQPGGYTYIPDHNYSSPKNASPQAYLSGTSNTRQMNPRHLFIDGKQGTNHVMSPQVPTPQALNTLPALRPINGLVKSPNIHQNNNITNATLPKQPTPLASETPNGVGRFVANTHNLTRQQPKNAYITQKPGLNSVAQNTFQPIHKRLDPRVQRILDKQIRLSAERIRQEQTSHQNMKNNNKVGKKPGEILPADSQNYINLPKVRVEEPAASSNVANTTSLVTSTSTSTAPISKHLNAAPISKSLPEQSNRKIPPIKSTSVRPNLAPSRPPSCLTPRNKLMFQNGKRIVQPPRSNVKPASPKVEPPKSRIIPNKIIPSARVPITSVPVVDLSGSPAKKKLSQSPVLQQQMRQFMDHLHLLQASHASGKVELPTSTSGNNTASKARAIASNASNRVTNVNNLPKMVPLQRKRPLIAARNLSELQEGGSVSAKNSSSASPLVSKSPSIRVVGSRPSTSRNVLPSMGHHINGVPVAKIVTRSNQTHPKIVNVPNGLIHSPSGKRIIISPKKSLVKGHQLPKAPVGIVSKATTNNRSSQKLMPTGGIGNVPSTRPASQNPPGSITQRNISKSTSELSKRPPIKNRAKNSVVTPRRDQVLNRNSVPPSRANSFPTISVPQSLYSRLDKENRNKRRLSLKSGNSPRVSASIDLSQESSSQTKNYLSPQIVKTLKQKGVSIRNVDQGKK